MVSHPNRRRATKAKPALSAAVASSQNDYSGLLNGVRNSFAAATSSGERLFLTDAEDLFDIYLDALPAERQEHTCHCCRRFIRTYGGLVSIADNGSLRPVLWASDGVPEFYAFAFEALSARVKRSRIVSPFLTKDAVWGVSVTGQWPHPSITPNRSYVFGERSLSADQAMAAAKENYRTVITAINEFTPAMLDEALRVLSAGALARSEKFVSPVKWLRALHDRPKGRNGENILWAAVASAPEGYCHPRAGMVGSLLEDIAAGMSFDAIKVRFDAKMAPLQYQRPQALPTAGNLKAAEALVAKMGLAPSLERRFARVDEVQAAWTPAIPSQKAAAAGGVFGHLQVKNAEEVASLRLPTVTITWDKFARTVLPTAQRLEMLVPSTGRFVALTTAVNSDAPPVLKWDRDDERNPVAWYVYPNGSPARQWGLTAGAWAKVSAITPFPNLWGTKPMPYVADGLILVLEGAEDVRSDAGNALFPECLRDDLHGIRATVEAYSHSAVLSGRGAELASGYDIRRAAADCRLRVFCNGAWSEFQIDRWD